MAFPAAPCLLETKVDTHTHTPITYIHGDSFMFIYYKPQKCRLILLLNFQLSDLLHRKENFSSLRGTASSCCFFCKGVPHGTPSFDGVIFHHLSGMQVVFTPRCWKTLVVYFYFLLYHLLSSKPYDTLSSWVRKAVKLSNHSIT